MMLPAIFQTTLFMVILTLLAVPLGGLMAWILQGDERFMKGGWGAPERALYRLAGIHPAEEMTWKRYAVALLLFNLVGTLGVYALQRLQGVLPLNPSGMGAVSPEVSFNTAVSFVTNTNWQTYGGETTMSHLTQMLALTVQNFLSAATGMAVLLALLRGWIRRETQTVGNFWVDLTRSVLYVLLPLAAVFALFLASQGVVQTWAGSVDVPLLDSTTHAEGGEVTTQHIALGPAASQVSIKQLGTNGGGFFNANSAHPLENPSPLTNFAEMLAILLLPAALCFTLGKMVKDLRQGWTLYATMVLLFVPCALGVMVAEQGGNPILTSLGVDQLSSPLQAGGNMEGKEVRFGIIGTGLFAAATTAASNGSVNAMHDSFTPLGGLVPMALMQLGEVVFGGVGSGLYGLLLYALLAVFIAGQMVGRTPTYLGKRVEAYEIKMASLAILLPQVATLAGTALACIVPAGTAPLGNPGIHGFSEVLYAFSSGANNNGSAFGGLTASGPFYAISIGLAMAIGRYGVIIPVLAIAGSLARKKFLPTGPGTLPTHTPLFVALLAGTVLLLGALTFLPALALGPIVEHLILFPR